MAVYSRYAVYYVPPKGSALAHFGATWLGWDLDPGTPLPHPDLPGLAVPIAEVTATPRRYGFHGTLKPPFRLADNDGGVALRSAVAALAARSPAILGPPLALSPIGRFLALMPSAPFPELDRLAAACVTELDAFRAPPSEAELSRRRAAGLSAAQEAYLARWGYPYVLGEFRFHLTLTGPLDAPTAAEVASVLAPLAAPHCAEPFTVGEICLCGELSDGHFQIVERYSLTG